MSEDEAKRIVRARALMWQNASSDEQAKWLRQVEQFDAEMAIARQQAAYRALPDAEESDGRHLRAVQA